MFIPKEVLDIAEAHFESARKEFDDRVQRHQLMCQIFQAYAGPGQQNHNCLGCNFDELTAHISNCLKACSEGAQYFTLQLAYFMYLQLLNNSWERITDVFDIISVPEGYRARHYQPLIKMRRWANFFKHPKEFGWLVHHPQYTIEGSPHAATFSSKKNEYRIVDDEFLKKYYTADRSKGLASEFRGLEQKVVVVLPDVAQLTSQVCDCLTNFVEVVTKNPVYHEILNDKATIINYFENQDPPGNECN